jgi:hypothetical protein
MGHAFPVSLWNLVSNSYGCHLPSSLLTFLLNKVNEAADEVDEQDDQEIPGENPVPNVENPPDDPDNANQAASVDPGDDADDGAVDGPPTSSYVDLAQTVGMYRVYYLIYLFI